MPKPVQRSTVCIIVAIIIGLALFELLTLEPVYAAGIIVNSTADTVSVDGSCTLREAIANANADSDTTGGDCVAGSDPDTITITATGTILLNNPLTVTANLTIAGPGAGQLAVDGQNSVRVLNVTTGTLALADLTVQNGNATDSGGGIYAADALTLTNVSVLSNTATGNGGGGAYAVGAVALTGSLFQNNQSGNSSGGGLRAQSTLMLTATQFIGNRIVGSGVGGGAYVSGAAVLIGGLFQDNSGSMGTGGLRALSTLTMSGTQFISNTAAAGDGGGVYASGAVTLTNGLFQNNNSSWNGGGLSTGSTLTLSGTRFISNTASWNGGGAYASGAVILTNGLFQNNESGGVSYYGGGLYAGSSLSLSGTQFLSNTATDDGGGVYASGAVTLTNGLFRNNQSISGNGGGLNADSVMLTSTIFISNTATGGGGAYVRGEVAGNYSRLVNALFARNQADGNGAALYLLDPFGSGGTVDVLHTTIASPTLASNSAVYVPIGSAGIFYSIIASHTVDIRVLPGAFVYEDYNLFDDTAVFSGTVISGGNSLVGDPAFLKLAADDYHLTTNSAAIDAASTSTVTIDFEGDVRPFGAAPDIGYDELTNLAPVAVGDTLTVTEDSVNNSVDVLLNDSDGDGDPLSVTAIGLPDQGGAVVFSSAIVTYTPAADFFGTETFTYTISDSGGLTDTARVTITVSPVNDPPVANNVNLATPEDTPLSITVIPGYASDVDGDSLTVLTVGTPLSGTTTTDGSAVIYTPTLNFTGTAIFTYTVGDPGGLTDTATITVTVGGVNDPPLALDDASTTDEDTPVTIDVLSNDSDPDGQTPFLDTVGAPGNGTAAVLASAVVYTPTPDFNGLDVFTYTISDGALTATATVTVTVNPVNDLPTLDPLGDLMIDEDAGPQTVILSGVGSGAANETQTLTVTASSTDTGLIPDLSITYTSPNPSGDLGFTPVTDRFGAATVVVTVSDGLSQIARSFQVTVDPVNDPPTLDPLGDLTIPENAGPQTVVLSGVGAGPNETQAVTVTAVSTNTALLPHPDVTYTSPNSSGGLAFTPVVSQYGSARVIVTVSDGLSQTMRSFLVTVNPILFVETTAPADNGRVIARDGSIRVTFSRALDNSTVNTRTFSVWGKQTGVYEGTFTFGSVQFDAVNDFKPGEEIVVGLSAGIQAANGASLTPYTWGFRAAAAGGSGLFVDSGQELQDPTNLVHPSFAPLGPQSVLDSQAVALGDLDGDGDLDAFVARNGVSNTVWLNDGGLQGGTPGIFSDSGQRLGNFNSWAAALGDLDGDGDLDAFVGNYDQGNIIWLNDGVGTFGDSGQRLGHSDTYAVALGDLDGDGDLDAWAGNDVGQANRVWLNDGGIFRDSGQELGFSDSRAVALGDLDGDGDLDAWVGNSDGQANQVWLNMGGLQGGTLGTFSDSGQRLGQSDTYAVALGDLDGDGDLDAFVGNLNGEADTVWLNDGGTFNDSGQRLGSTASWAVALGDVDADGDLDAWVGNVSFGLTSVPANTVWLNTGGGVFSDSGQGLGGADSLAVALGDVDEDGDLDAWVGNSTRLGQANKVWLNQNASGQVRSVVVIPARGGSLVYTDSHGITTVVDFPAGAVNEVTEFRYTPTESRYSIFALRRASTFPAGLGFAGRSFTLQAYREGELVPGLVFARSITIAVGYDAAHVAGLEEETLELRYWHGSVWASDGIALLARDMVNDRLVVTVAHLTDFALLGQERQRWWIYLPLVVKD